MADFIFKADGPTIDYTPSSAVAAGDIVIDGQIMGFAPHAISANVQGELCTYGVGDIALKAEAVAKGIKVYWDADGDPYGGTAGAGAATADQSKGRFAGITIAAASATAGKVRILLCPDFEEDDVLTSIADPGDGEAIPVTKSGTVNLVTAGAETRTLAIPTFEGQQLILNMKTDGGNGVVTVASAINATGNNTLTFADTSDYIWLIGINNNGTLAWRIVGYDGVALSTV